jgi:aspartate aminotransferase-like enzyme
MVRMPDVEVLEEVLQDFVDCIDAGGWYYDTPVEQIAEAREALRRIRKEAEKTRTKTQRSLTLATTYQKESGT